MSKIIDSHMHCGIQNVDQPIELIKAYLARAGITGACLFAPVEDIYDRYNYHFEDTPSWMACRQRANEYLLNLQGTDDNVTAYYFVWNDFKKEELARGYRGIKWHRHEYEPVYHYDDPACEEFMQEVYARKLPVVLEESFANTRYFLQRVDGRTPVIIPHMGGLNGGFSSLFAAGIWDNETVYADTALGSSREISRFLERYGADRLIFGSDFPFGTPTHELQKIRSLRLHDAEYRKITSENILRLTAGDA